MAMRARPAAAAAQKFWELKFIASLNDDAKWSDLKLSPIDAYDAANFCPVIVISDLFDDEQFVVPAHYL